MPAPELTTQTPGEPIVNTTPATGDTNDQALKPALFVAKHNGGGRWKIWSTALDDWFSEYVVAGEGAKTQAEAEAERLNAGGEPFAKPAEQPAPEVKPSKPAPATGDIDAATLKQPVLTDEGWLCPVPPVKG